jgi:hypothetical protein
MASLVLSGDTSGSVTLAAPAVAGSNTQTLVAATGTLAPLISGTAVTASGTSVDFTNIPSWVKRITVMFSGVSTGGTGNYQLQLGDAGGIEITGYDSRSGNIDGASTSISTLTTGFLLKTSVTAASTYVGQAVIVNISGNLWVCSSTIAAANAVSSFQNGTKTLSDTLTQLRVIGSATGSPSDTFDAGTINILYE